MKQLINWDGFKILIFEPLKTLFKTSDHNPENFYNKTFDHAWLGEITPFDFEIDKALENLDPTFQKQILQCDRWNRFGNLPEDERTTCILSEIVWRIINRFNVVLSPLKNNSTIDYNQLENAWNNYQEVWQGHDHFEWEWPLNEQVSQWLSQKFNQLQISDFYHPLIKIINCLAED